MRWGRQVVAMVLIGLMVHGIQANYGRYREMQEICRQIEVPSSVRERPGDPLTERQPNERQPNEREPNEREPDDREANPLSIAELAIEPTSERLVTHVDYTFPTADSDPKALSPQFFSPQSASAMPEAEGPDADDRESERTSADRGMAAEPMVDEIMDIRRRLGGSGVASVLETGGGAMEDGAMEAFRSALLDLSVRRYKQGEFAGSEPETEKTPRDPLLGRADTNQKDTTGKREKGRPKADRLE